MALDRTSPLSSPESGLNTKAATGSPETRDIPSTTVVGAGLTDDARKVVTGAPTTVYNVHEEWFPDDFKAMGGTGNRVLGVFSSMSVARAFAERQVKHLELLTGKKSESGTIASGRKSSDPDGEKSMDEGDVRTHAGVEETDEASARGERKDSESGAGYEFADEDEQAFFDCHGDPSHVCTSGWDDGSGWTVEWGHTTWVFIKTLMVHDSHDAVKVQLPLREPTI